MHEISVVKDGHTFVSMNGPNHVSILVNENTSDAELEGYIILLKINKD